MNKTCHPLPPVRRRRYRIHRAAQQPTEEDGGDKRRRGRCLGLGAVAHAQPRNSGHRPERGGWILGKLEADAQEPPPLRLVTGETLPYLGRELPLVVNDAEVRRPSARLDGERLTVWVARDLAEEERQEWARAALTAWYKAQVWDFLVDRVAQWLPVMGRSDMPRVLVREQRSRWGSCSADGTLRFSWRLAMVEPSLIESVVVHELAHLDVMNHSPAFWDVVLRAMPDARERRKLLGEAGRSLPL